MIRQFSASPAWIAISTACLFNTGSGTTTADNYHGWQTRNSKAELAQTGVRFQDEDPWYVAGFELEVPNGDYTVTVAGGKIGWNIWSRIYVEGTTYGGLETQPNDNLYIADIAPDKDPETGDSDGYIQWKVSQDFGKNEPVLTYGQIKLFGYNNNNPYWEYMEFLYLENETITVTDGKLTVLGAESGEEFYLNYIHVTGENIVPEPMTVLLLGLGGLFLRRRKR